jgi:Family of unknown function (DUF6644)
MGGASMTPLWTWLQQVSFIDKVGDTGWLYSGFSVLHYFCVFVMVGTMALVDLRVLGLAARRQTVGQVATQLFPWMWTAFGIAVISGFFEFAPTAASFAPDFWFRTKMVAILLAVAFGVIIQLGAPKWSRLQAIPAWGKVVAVVSLVLWLAAIVFALDVAAISGLG